MIRKIFSKKNIPLVAGVTASVAVLGGLFLYRQFKKSGKPSGTQYPRGLVDPDNAKRVELTQEEAETRFQCIYGVRYNVALSLAKGLDKYAGATTISFRIREEAKEIPEELFVDFRGKVLTKCELNGVKLKKFQNQRIYFKTADLKRGEERNTLTVEFENSFVHNGQGPHRFTDPVDSEDYIWTQFESFFCHLLFPCFDQPSLKAPLKMTIIAPQDWKVVVNELPAGPAFKFCKESENVLEQKYGVPKSLSQFAEHYRENLDHYVHIFEETPAISTYLYAVCAGPYAEFKNELESHEKFVPMRAYCRKSLAPHFEYNQFFHTVMTGIRFFESFFGQKYPFSKYDQILVPEFNWGAMENVGAVTFTEHYIFKSEPTQRARRSRSYTILHELTHMWFGDLVTMHWWNDLWLNESFATFVGYLCQKETAKTLFENPITKTAIYDPWFAVNIEKLWAYDTDSKSTTHPIAGDVKDTEVAENIFDGITYAKGGAFLKQFYKRISGEVFSKGLHIYFARHKFQNTKLDDFITAMQEACDDTPTLKGFKVMEWAEVWLKTYGINTLEYTYETDPEGRITKFEIKQGFRPNCEEKYREQVIDVAFLTGAGNEKLVENVTVEAKEITLVPQIVGLQAPEAVILNGDDWGYFIQAFKVQDMDYFSQNLKNIEKTLTRGMIWHYISVHGHDCKFSAWQQMLNIKANLEDEEDANIQNRIFGCLFGLLHNVFPFEKRDEMADYFWDLLRDKMIPRWNKETSGDAKNIVNSLLLKLVSLTSSERTINTAINWLEKKESILAEEIKERPLEFNQNARRSLIRTIWASKTVDIAVKRRLLEKEIEGDESDDAEKLQTYCEAAQPIPEIKKKVFESSIDPADKRSQHLRNAAMHGFQQWKQADLLEEYTDIWFDRILNIFETSDRRFAEAVYYNLNPANYLKTPEILEKLKNLRTQITDEQKYMKRLVTNTIEGLEKVLKEIELMQAEM